MISLKRICSVNLLLIMVVSWCRDLSAQKLELSPFIGYETRATLYTSLGYLYIGSGMDYGAAVDFNLGKNLYAEASYSHMMTNLNIDEGYNERYLWDLGVNYYSLGILQEIRAEAKLSPYGLFSLGWVNYRPQMDNISVENKMHISVAGGFKIRATERIRLRLQARLLMPIMYAGRYFSGGPGGTDMTVSATSVAFQGDFTAALVFVLRE